MSNTVNNQIDDPSGGGDMEQSYGESQDYRSGSQPNPDKASTTICELVRTKQWLENQLIELKTQLRGK